MTDERGGRYFREARFFFAGDKVAAQSHTPEARSLMGYMRDMHSLGGPAVQVQYMTLQDGTQIKATMMNGQFSANISSPSHKREKPSLASVVYVRPFDPPGHVDDWRVTLTEGSSSCVVNTEFAPQRYYSNRNWFSAGGDIVSVLGGTDWDRYFPTALGDHVVLNDQIMVSPGDVWGAAMYNGALVVARAVYTYVPTPTHVLLNFEVIVDGVLKLTSPTIDSLAYRGAQLFGGYDDDTVSSAFVQKTLVFSPDGSLGVCCLSPLKYIRVVLSTTLGAVTVTYSIEDTPQTTSAATNSWWVDRDFSNSSSVDPLTCVETFSATGHDNSGITGGTTTYALAADFDYSSGALVFFMVTENHLSNSMSSAGSSGGSKCPGICLGVPVPAFCSSAASSSATISGSHACRFWWSDTGATAIQLTAASTASTDISNTRNDNTGMCDLVAASLTGSSTSAGFTNVRVESIDVRFRTGVVSYAVSTIASTQSGGLSGVYTDTVNSYAQRIATFGLGGIGVTHSELNVIDNNFQPGAPAAGPTWSLPADVRSGTDQITMWPLNDYWARHVEAPAKQYVFSSPSAPSLVFLSVTDTQLLTTERSVQLFCPAADTVVDVTSAFSVVSGDMTTNHFGVAKE